MANQSVYYGRGRFSSVVLKRVLQHRFLKISHQLSIRVVLNSRFTSGKCIFYGKLHSNVD